MTIKVKGFSWVGVATNDFAASLRFFTEVLGLEIEVRGEHGAILRVAPGQQLEIFGGQGSDDPLHATPTVAFEVDDLAAASQALVAGGAQLVGEVGGWNGSEWQYFRDPTGNLFEIKRSAAPAP